jgi:hypothetical protein
MDKSERLDSAKIQIFPYTRIVGQEHLKLALELAYLALKRIPKFGPAAKVV